MESGIEPAADPLREKAGRRDAEPVPADHRGPGPMARAQAGANAAPYPAAPEAGETFTAGNAAPRPRLPDVRERIEAAIRAIDQNADATGGPEIPPPDYVITPVEHAGRYERSAPELAARLRMSDVRVAAESFTDRDARAERLRKEFDTLAERARTSVLVAGVSAAALVATAGLSGVPGLGGGVTAAAVLALSLAAVVASALAAGYIYRIRAGSVLERRLRWRAEAEVERLRYFSLVAAAYRLSNPLLQLEYFRRYQLDVQRAYYRVRGEQHRARADRRFSVVAAAMVAAGIATGVAGVLGATLAVGWTSLAALALVAQAFGARAENREAAEQSARNADRYEHTAAALDRLCGMLDQVRDATAALGPDEEPIVLRRFVEAVHEQLLEEHREWLDDTRRVGASIDRLEQLIGEAERQRSAPPAASVATLAPATSGTARRDG
jgi:hypothetical protein